MSSEGSDSKGHHCAASLNTFWYKLDEESRVRVQRVVRRLSSNALVRVLQENHLRQTV